MDKDISVIPKGLYCHSSDGLHTICPYWSMRDDLPEQENGYCSYLEKSDWDINEEIGEVTVYNMKSGEKFKMSAHLLGGNSLLWDQCKECRINEDEGDNDE